MGEDFKGANKKLPGTMDIFIILIVVIDGVMDAKIDSNSE